MIVAWLPLLVWMFPHAAVLWLRIMLPAYLGAMLRYGWRNHRGTHGA